MIIAALGGEESHREKETPVDLAWRRSSRCDATACVEVARAGQWVAVRDSKKPERVPLTYTTDEWAAFIAGVKAGEFDDLAVGD